jgi:hypothetical protein
MPILTVRMSKEEIAAAASAAARLQMTRSEFARRAITSASAAETKTASARGALRGKYTYKQAMKLLRG